MMSNENPLAGVRACVFDAYGTLFDYASAAAGARDALGGKFDVFVATWRDKQLQYSWLRAAQGRHADFWQVTGDALDFTFDTLGISSAGLREQLMNLYLRLELFPEAGAMLARLKESGMRTAILSNGTPEMLRAIVGNAALAPLLDCVLSVEEVGVFKPSPRVYQLAVDRLGVSAGEILFCSSNGWDAYAASAFGMKVVWCNRYGQRPERLPGNPDYVVTSLAGLPSLLAGEARYSA